jgi:hypothetical protein
MKERFHQGIIPGMNHSPTSCFSKFPNNRCCYITKVLKFSGKKRKSKNQCFVTGSFVKTSGSFFKPFERTGTGDSLILEKQKFKEPEPTLEPTTSGY